MKLTNTLSISKKIDLILILSIFLSIQFLPSFPITSSLYIGFEEILILIVGFRILQKKSFNLNTYLRVLILYLFYIIITILVNKNRAPELNNYFELYKVIKYLIVFYFSYTTLNFNKDELDSVIRFSFIFLIAFNFLHYFNIFHFNEIVVPYFDVDGRDVKFFGINSIGLPDTKRMLGTMGNPNDNAILLLFYAAYFFDSYSNKSTISKKESIYFYLSFLSVFLCQSRTGIITYLFMYLIWIVLNRVSFKKLIYNVLIFFGLILFLYTFDKNSVNYVSNTVSEIQINSSHKVNKHKNFELNGNNKNDFYNDVSDVSLRSVSTRIEMWYYLYNKISMKPILGWGPNKAFIYKNKLHPDNEYLFQVYRYGVIGLIFYFIIILYPFINGIKIFKQNQLYIYITILILITAFTNSPLSNPRIFILYAIVVGYVLNRIEKTKLNSDDFS